MADNFFLTTRDMDMAKVAGPLSVVKVCMCENKVSVSGWSPIACEGFCRNLTSQVHSVLLQSSDNVGNSYLYKSTQIEHGKVDESMNR